MIARKPVMLITLGACLLGLSALGSEKNPVTRPHKGWMTFHAVINLITGSFEATGVGHGTGIGDGVSYVAGQVDLSLLPVIAIISATGTITAANGDQFFIELVQTPSGAVTVFTGGTGRFEGATGSTTEVSAEDMVVTFDGPLMIIDYIGMEVGAVTY